MEKSYSKLLSALGPYYSAEAMEDVSSKSISSQCGGTSYSKRIEDVSNSSISVSFRPKRSNMEGSNTSMTSRSNYDSSARSSQMSMSLNSAYGYESSNRSHDRSVGSMYYDGSGKSLDSLGSSSYSKGIYGDSSFSPQGVHTFGSSLNSIHNSHHSHSTRHTLNSNASDSMDDEAPVYKTKKIKQLDRFTYVFHCTRKKHTRRINRNMIVLKYGKRVTVINPLRLTEEGERKLEGIASVSKIVRLEPSPHGDKEDMYYLSRFQGARRWAPGKFSSSTYDLPIHRELNEDDFPPDPNCSVFCFRETKEPQAAILLLREQHQHGNILITGESIQAQKNNPFVNMPTIAAMKIEGLLDSEVVVSKAWIKKMAPNGRSPQRKISAQQTTPQPNIEKLRVDFQRLQRLPFDRLVSTSGNVLKNGGAHESVERAVDFTFPVWSSASRTEKYRRRASLVQR